MRTWVVVTAMAAAAMAWAMPTAYGQAAAGAGAKADIVATTEAPKIDGDLSDGAWKGKEVAGKQLDVYSGKAATVQMKVYMTYDDKNVYVACEMPEALIEKLVAQVKQRNGEVWQDDAVEIFLDPMNGTKGAAYYQIIVNSIGTLQTSQAKAANTMEVKAAAKVDKEAKKWTIEVQIPLESLGVKESPKGKTWLANFMWDRQTTGMGENFAWADTGEDAHNWQSYGHITFK